MKTSVIKKHILDALAPYVKEHGFKTVKKNFSIVKKEKDKEFKIIFLDTNWGNSIDLEISLWCNFEIIREIANAEEFIAPNGGHLVYNCAQMNLFAFKKLKEGKIKLSDTLQFSHPKPSSITLIDGQFYHNTTEYEEFGIILEPKNPVFIIKTDAGITRVIDYIKRLLPYAFEYFNWVGSLEAIDRLYNQLPIQHNVNTITLLSQVAVGLTAAKLTGNPDYDNIKNSYLEVLKQRLNDDKPLLRLIDYLDSREFSEKYMDK